MVNEKRLNYTLHDSSHVFLYAVLMPQIISFLFIVILICIASFIGVEYGIVADHFIVGFISLFIAEIGFLIIFFLYNKIKRIDFIRATKIKEKINLKQVFILISIMIVCLFFFSPLVNLIDYLVSLTGYSASTDLPIDLTTISGFITGVVALAIFPAVCEELIFRGIIFKGFEKFGVKKAIIFSAILFALMHMSIQQTAYQIIIGIVLAYAFYITGSLLAPIIMHFINNFVIVVLSYYNELSTAPENTTPLFTNFFDYVEVVLYTILGFIIIVQLFKLLQNKTKKLVVETETTVENVEPILKEQPVKDENTQALEQFLLNEKIREEKQDKKVLILAVLIAVSFWIIDFINYLS